MENDTIPSQLGPVDTIPSTLGPMGSSGSHKQENTGFSGPFKLALLVAVIAAGYLLTR